MRRSNYLVGILGFTLSSCSAFAQGNPVVGSRVAEVVSAQHAISARVRPPAAGNAGSLYYILPNGVIRKIELKSGREKKASYGVPGGQGLVVDKHSNLYESWVESLSGGVVVLDRSLQMVRSFSLPQETGALSLTVDAKDQLYLACFSDELFSIEVFAKKASGAAKPLRTISGNTTDLAYPISIGVDGAGYLYAANTSYYGHPAADILVFAPGANGDAAPVRVISGDQTGLTSPVGLALGADGNLYVANQLSTETYDILVFPLSADGNAPPIRTLQPGSYGRTIALGSDGQMYLGPGSGDANHGFAIFAPGASGNDAPIGYAGAPFKGGTYPAAVALQHPWFQP